MYIIAEIGVNHNGSKELTENLVNLAASCGANAVKFQHFKAKKLASKKTPKVAYQMETSDPVETHFEMLRNLEISDEIELAATKKCRELNIDFISTPYDPESVNHLIELGCKYIKTASADIVDHRIHRRIANSGCHALIATGMASMTEIESCLEIYKKAKNKPILLHCVSNYPCSQKSLNLRVISEMSKKFGVHVGFSDHSVGARAATIAYTLGARYFEKHFTLDKSLPGPDHKASVEPAELRELVDELKATETALGSPIKTVQPEEIQMKNVSRKSAHTAKDIKKGDIILERNITMLRPGEGISGSAYFDLIGKTALNDLPAGSQIKIKDFK